MFPWVSFILQLYSTNNYIKQTDLPVLFKSWGRKITSVRPPALWFTHENVFFNECGSAEWTWKKHTHCQSNLIWVHTHRNHSGLQAFLSPVFSLCTTTTIFSGLFWWIFCSVISLLDLEEVWTRSKFPALLQLRISPWWWKAARSKFGLSVAGGLAGVQPQYL